MDIPSRIPQDEIVTASRILWADKVIADEVAKESIRIISQTYKRKLLFFSGRRSKWIVGGLFYLLSYRYGCTKKQNELADVLGTSDVTVRDSYRHWLKTFPELFPDIIGKMANDQNLRYFVLIDLKEGRVS